ncbi:MAG: hypothetical protein WCI73_12150 [Phycisphaerae bacterium]
MKYGWTGVISAALLVAAAGAATPSTLKAPTSAGLNAPPPEVLPDGSILHGPFGYPSLQASPPAPVSVPTPPVASPVAPATPPYQPMVETYYSAPYPFGIYGGGSSLVYPYNPYDHAGRDVRNGPARSATIVHVVPTNGAAALPPIQPAYPLGVRAGNATQGQLNGR